MKKYLILCISIISLFVSGCTNRNEKNVLNELTKKIDKLNSYYIDGELELINGEDNYTYDVKVSFLKDNNFKVSLKNKVNDHEQIILRNTEGVYV